MLKLSIFIQKLWKYFRLNWMRFIRFYTRRTKHFKLHDPPKRRCTYYFVNMFLRNNYEGIASNGLIYINSFGFHRIITELVKNRVVHDRALVFKHNMTMRRVASMKCEYNAMIVHRLFCSQNQRFYHYIKFIRIR